MEFNEQEYRRLRGEYLSVAASLEYSLAWVTAYLLDLGEHRVFKNWFTETTIAFSARVALFESLITHEDGWRDPNIAGLPKRIYEVQRVRNLIAHSFRQFDSSITARGFQLPTELEDVPNLERLLEEAKSVESMVGGMLESYLVGPIGPISADDFADWPL